MSMNWPQGVNSRIASTRTSRAARCRARLPRGFLKRIVSKAGENCSASTNFFLAKWTRPLARNKRNVLRYQCVKCVRTIRPGTKGKTKPYMRGIRLNLELARRVELAEAQAAVE